MSLFGDMDIDEIGDDPFAIAPNTYLAVVTDCYIKEKDGDKSFIIKWKINEPGSEYHGMGVTEFFNLIEEGREWADLSGDEKTRQKFFKKRLREAFDLTPEEMGRFTPDDAKNLEAMITVTMNKGKGANEGKTFTNVNSALSLRLYEEQNPSAEMSGSFGL